MAAIWRKKGRGEGRKKKKSLCTLFLSGLVRFSSVFDDTTWVVLIFPVRWLQVMDGSMYITVLLSCLLMRLMEISIPAHYKNMYTFCGL